MDNGVQISNFLTIMTFLWGQRITKTKNVLFSPAGVVKEEASKIVTLSPMSSVNDRQVWDQPATKFSKHGLLLKMN